MSEAERKALEKGAAGAGAIGYRFTSRCSARDGPRGAFTLKTTKILQILIPELIGYPAQLTAFDVGDIAQWTARNLTSEHAQWSMAQAISVLADVERLCPQLIKSAAGWSVTTC